ncbi:esterase like protein [Teratosphaeria destructans]|uniref:Esterase like protein n=1 Tax=Teratosphaeria destructans TaxID=418781 RepID=A0A9W7W156_9PEZI|nr:esterase like protein [Teratosphaeria destructans]
MISEDGMSNPAFLHLYQSIPTVRAPRYIMRRLRIVALGSSFAAGPGIEPQNDPAARRSGRNYAHQLADLVDAELTDLTVSGATLLNVLREPQEITGSPRAIFQPQLDSVPSNADIVTLTGGGNDLGYSGGMVFDSLMASVPAPVRYMCRTWIPHPGTDLTLEQLVSRFVEVLDAVHQKAPQAKIFLVQYQCVFGPLSRPGPDLPLSWDSIEYYRRRGVVLDRAYETAAKARPGFVELLSVADWSEDHAIGSEQPWMSGFSLGMIWNRHIPYHPNLIAHTAIAEKLAAAIRSL